MKRKNNKVVFKEYNQDQQLLLPPSLEELIPLNHLVRTLSKTIDQMNIDPLLKEYIGGGTSSYHPKMLLKVLVYAYTQKIYSSRMIAKSLRENLNFMWLSGNNRPNFRTINHFRSSRLKSTIQVVFSSIVELLIEAGMIKLENYFLDGTKIEANANKYSFVWGKATKKHKKRLQEQVKDLFDEIEKINDQENKIYGNNDLEEIGENSEITAEQLGQKVKELDNILAGKPKNKDLKKSIKRIKTDYLPRLEKYEKQEKILQNRNSYSKTDTDATFMRMKEDHMLNGQLKPGYNVQIGTENQFIVGYSLHQSPTDTNVMIPHLNQLKKQLSAFPKNLVADAGYGSEQNYDYLENKNIGKYVKFNYFHMEQKRSFKKNKFRVENLKYDSKKDLYICPSGKPMKYLETRYKTTNNGFISTERIYQCISCKSCRLRKMCHNSSYDRRIAIREKLNAFKQEVRENLLSEKGLKLRRKRPIETESVFGQIKNNRTFRRFILRGLKKVNIEWGLLSLAHNIMKIQTIPV